MKSAHHFFSNRAHRMTHKQNDHITSALLAEVDKLLVVWDCRQTVSHEKHSEYVCMSHVTVYRQTSKWDALQESVNNQPSSYMCHCVLRCLNRSIQCNVSAGSSQAALLGISRSSLWQISPRCLSSWRCSIQPWRSLDACSCTAGNTHAPTHLWWTAALNLTHRHTQL